MAQRRLLSSDMAGLAEYDELEGIAWKWQSIDGAMMKAPLAQEAVGPNPTDRGKKWKQETCTGGRAWHPYEDRPIIAFLMRMVVNQEKQER